MDNGTLSNETPKTNTFVVCFQIKELPDGQLQLGQTDFIFDPQQYPSLLNPNDIPTETGFKVLIENLTGAIIQLADTAEKHTTLNADALKRKAATKITGARRLKLIGLN